MIARIVRLLIIVANLAVTACANTPADTGQYVPQIRPYLPVEVSVYSDSKGKLPDYPVDGDAVHYRAYLQAYQTDRYRIRISNNTGQRVAVVVAVDGRNIISGEKSYLHNSERMYILNPYSSDEYEGWRSSQNQVNRFYFTEAADSYAAAWGDHSAMGVIAVAVYAERSHPRLYDDKQPMTKGGSNLPGSAAREAAPGTGYGESQYSPSTVVSFEPLPGAMEKVFLKYEWQETLCKKGIAAACQQPLPEQNRFWPDDNGGYVPPPPRRRY